ncbi:MAG: hypothetical protein IPN76_08905 [Saprospiraceae bacterium]|nr:hypothetical protein [Saprospiraceae bacterium]
MRSEDGFEQEVIRREEEFADCSISKYNLVGDPTDGIVIATPTPRSHNGGRGGCRSLRGEMPAPCGQSGAYP